MVGAAGTTCGIALIALLAPGVVPAPPELAAITERGRILARHDQAAGIASEAVLARKPEDGSVTHYVARAVPGGWRVVFGRLEEDGSRFRIAWEVKVGASGKSPVVVEYDPPREDTDYFLRASRAIRLASSDLGDPGRPTNVAVFPSGSGDFWVYFYPAPSRPGVWTAGGDWRYKVSADGRRILEKRKLHESTAEVAAPPAGQEARFAVQVTVLDEVPEDTDVLAVLRRTPKVPQYIRTKSFLYEIAVDGRITLLGPAAAPER